MTIGLHHKKKYVIMKLYEIWINMFKTKLTGSQFPLNDFPDEILVAIFSWLPINDLKNYCLVNKRWRDIINSQAFWKLKCEVAKRFIPYFKLEELPAHYYRNIYLKNPYGRNLIKNPSGQEGFKYWHVVENGGDHWKVENPPKGADPVPDTDIQHCFATSYANCKKYQSIDLIKEGINEDIVDHVRPDIEVSELHASRFDCGTQYSLKVELKNSKYVTLEKFKFGPYIEEQWTGRKWSQIKHIFTNYPSGVRHIVFTHSGTDAQFWAGHYGSKMACATVRFVRSKNELVT